MARSRPADDDYDDQDFDDHPARRSSNGGGNTAVKIIGIIAGVLLIMFLGCGALIGYGCYSVRRGVKDLEEKAFEQAERAQVEMKKAQAERDSTDKGQSHKFGESFLQELKARRYDAAYQMTTGAYRQRITRKEFEEFVSKNYEGLTGFGSLQDDFFAPDTGKTYILTKKTHATGRFIDVTITVVKEEGGWKVDQLDVGGK